MIVKIKKLHEDAIVPEYQTEGSAGFDLHALEDITIYPGDTELIKTGLSFEIPVGYELQIRPRSGMSLKTKFRVANSPGTVDADFRGEVCIIGENTGELRWVESNEEIEIHGALSTVSMVIPQTKTDPEYLIEIKKGDRIAQGVLQKVEQAAFVVVEELSDTERGAGGFGSTNN